MSENLYVATFEPSSGKSLVVLGLMNLLSQRVGKLGFFRPVVNSGFVDAPDSDIELVQSHFSIDAPYETMYGVTYEKARELASLGRHDELLNSILEKFKAAEGQFELVLCEGTDFTGETAAFEFDFNARVANHLGCSMVIVGNGSQERADDVVSSMRTVRGALERDRCSVVASIANRVDSEQFEATIAELRRSWPYDDPVYAIPEVARLSAPTIGEISLALGARPLFCSGEDLQRESLGYSIAAMQLPNFLSRVADDSLVITPGDRGDVILACVAIVYSNNAPRLSGLILTGGIEPDRQIMRLIEGFPRPPLPILLVKHDTYPTAVMIDDIRARITPNHQRKIAAAIDAFETHVDQEALAQRIEVTRSVAVTPLMFEYSVIERARQQRRRIVLPEGAEERILRAAEILRRRHVVDLTLLGAVDIIRDAITTLGLDLNDVDVVDPIHSEWREQFAETYFQARRHKGLALDAAADQILDVSYFGTLMVHAGYADGMVSGAIHTTAHTIRPALEIIKARPGISVVSSVIFMCLPDRVLAYGDCAINPNPNPAELADIAISSAETAATFGITPRVAMLSYSTGKSGRGQDVDLVREATRIAQEARPDLIIDGPIQYDAAIDPGVARTKAPDSRIAGQATVLIFPDLNTGNNTYKAVQRSARVMAVGPILQGLNKPVNDLSRGCTVADIVNTVAITAVQAQSTN